MAVKKITKYEYRYYDMPLKEPILALCGDSWKRIYGENAGHLHFHNILEIGICYYGEGSTFMEYPDGSIREDKYCGGEVTSIPHSAPHTTKTLSESEADYWEFLFIDAAKYINDFFPDNHRTAQRLLNEINSRPVFFKKGANDELYEIVSAIFREQKAKEHYYEETTRALIYSLLMHIARANHEYAKGQIVPPDTKGQIREALTYMENHYMEDLKVSDLAEICHISETHFRRQFLKNMNMSPVEYLNFVRVQAACELLDKTNYSMETVAIKSGFQTVSTFNRNFNKIVGDSPYQWKKNSHSYDRKVQEFKINAYKGW